ncbi:MAG: 4Fe-4S dicluster domain-containing protein [Thermodesulfovibrionales bacterium]|nr:4Fe-4S dicluster domain-containing protein [Thermodesulfovibrionales bacterium]
MNVHITTEIKLFCKSIGADLVGVADLKPFRSFITLPENLLDPFSYAISVAIRLNDDIIDSIFGRPTPEYAEHYRAVNVSLDKITSKLVDWISNRKFNALAIPASKILDEERLLGSISHKAIARMAGIGWQGKNLLIISPQFGPRIRLATVLTDMPLVADQPLKNRCGKCKKCTDSCPASAIKNVGTESHYKTREEAVHLDRCYSRLKTFKNDPEIKATICGVCIKVCPFGRKASKKN